MGHDNERSDMIIRILQVLAVGFVIAIISSGILLLIHPEYASFLDNEPETHVSTHQPKLRPPKAPVIEEQQQPVTVQSYDLKDRHLLELWSLMSIPAGHIDTVKYSKSPSTMELSGWAGHAALGMRFAYILFSACGQIIGHTVVNLVRPDVAKNVHDNLLQSGWRARLGVEDLPSCPKAALQAWGLAPTGNILWPLNGKADLEGTRPLPPTKKHIKFNSDVLHPSRVTLPQLRKIQILANRANLRRCAGTSCKIVGKIKRGTHAGYIVEQRGGWALLQLKDGAGWMAQSLFTAT